MVGGMVGGGGQSIDCGDDIISGDGQGLVDERRMVQCGAI